MSDAEVKDEDPGRGSYQLTTNQKIDLVVLIARYQGHGNLARGDLTKILEALHVSDTAVLKFAKRLKAGERPSQVVKSKKRKHQRICLQ